MSQFDYSELADRTRDNEIISYISKIHEYILGIILECYRDFENRVYIVHGAGAKSTSYDIVKACVTERIGKFSKQEILALCPSLGSSSVESALKKLVDEGYLVRLGSGRKTMYVRTDALR